MMFCPMLIKGQSMTNMEKKVYKVEGQAQLVDLDKASVLILHLKMQKTSSNSSLEVEILSQISWTQMVSLEIPSQILVLENLKL